MDDSSNAKVVPFDRFRHRVFTESVNIVELATAPIAFFKDSELVFDRTSVLLAIGDQHFLITAEHRLEEIYRYDYSPFILAASPNRPPTPLFAEDMIVSHDSQVDIAVFRLHADVVKNVRKEYRFLRLDDVRLAAPRAGEGPYFLVTGFPNASISVDESGRRRVEVSRYLTVRYDGHYGCLSDFVPASHIVLEYSRDSRHTSGHTGPPPPAPGLSGCGIWYLPTPEGIDAWTPKNLKLVGIQTAWLKHQYVRGTVISHALSMISGWFPNLRNAIRMHGIEL